MLEWWAILLIVLAVLIVLLVLLPILGGIIYRACNVDAPEEKLQGKTILITGASAGEISLAKLQ